jgi:hypothetical protein
MLANEHSKCVRCTDLGPVTLTVTNGNRHGRTGKSAPPCDAVRSFQVEFLAIADIYNKYSHTHKQLHNILYSVCLHIRLSVCLCIFIPPPTHRPIHPSVRPSIHLSLSIHIYIYIYIYIYLSIYLLSFVKKIYLSIDRKQGWWHTSGRKEKRKTVPGAWTHMEHWAICSSSARMPMPCGND